MRYLARRCGYVDEDGPRLFRETLESHRAKVSSMYGDLFLSRQKRKEEVAPETYVIFDPNADPDLVKDLLAERRFEDADTAYENLIHLRDGTPRSHLQPKGRRLREEITPLLFQGVIASRIRTWPLQPGKVLPGRRAPHQLLCPAGGKPGDPEAPGLPVRHVRVPVQDLH